jgi:hypothetical protein
LGDGLGLEHDRTRRFLLGLGRFGIGRQEERAAVGLLGRIQEVRPDIDAVLVLPGHVAEAEVAATIEAKISAEAASARIPVSIRLTAGNFVRDRG